MPRLPALGGRTCGKTGGSTAQKIRRKPIRMILAAPADVMVPTVSEDMFALGAAKLA